VTTIRPASTTLAIVVCTVLGARARAETGAVSGAIVNGQTEPGWPAVGALVMDFGGWGYHGSFCSGTLIAPRWVLTAGHCVTSGGQEGMWMQPDFTKFYIGPDARGSGHQPPTNGKLYQAAKFYPHPDYDPEDPLNANDIGLVQLKKDADTTPIAINTAALKGDLLMKQVLYVGFGQSNGLKATGSGVKRSTTMPMTWIDGPSYYTEPHGSGTCFGDSGGPGLLEMAQGEWRVVGVVSAGASTQGGGDPCLTGYGIYTRVDAYAKWISEVTGLALPDCSTGVCLCDEACGEGNACDNDRCRHLSCSAAVRCSEGCAPGDEGCALDCGLLTILDQQGDYERIGWCLAQKCPAGTIAGPERLACAQQNCAKTLDPCLASGAATADCPAHERCRSGCPAGDSLCLHACGVEAVAGVADTFAAMASCLADRCGAPSDGPGLAAAVAGACAAESCRTEVESCLPLPPPPAPEPVPEEPATSEEAPAPDCDGESNCAPAGDESGTAGASSGGRGGGCAANGPPVPSPALLLLLALLFSVCSVRPVVKSRS